MSPKNYELSFCPRLQTLSSSLLPFRFEHMPSSSSYYYYFFVMHWSLKLGQSRREHKAKSLRIIKRRWQQQQTSSPLLCSLTLSADDPLARTTNNLYIHNYIHTYLHILVCTILLRNGCRSAYLTDLIIISEPSGSLPPARSSATGQVKIERKKWKLRSLTRK